MLGNDGNIDLTYRKLTVFQLKDHPRRLWIDVNNTEYVLGDDTSCKFEGTPSFGVQTSPLGTSPLQPPPQQCICIGGHCNPPGCSNGQ